MKLVFSWVAVLFGCAALCSVAIADEGCSDKLGGSWEMVPMSAAQESTLDSAKGVIEFTFSPAEPKISISVGEKVDTNEVTVSQCDANEIELTKLGSAEKLEITFLDANSISVTTSQAGQGDEPQKFARVQ